MQKYRVLKPCFELMPAELKKLRQWLLWRGEWSDKKGKYDKPPFQVNGQHAKSDDPSTWTTFDAVAKAYPRRGYSGIGFVLTAEDPFAGVDLDHCRNRKTGAIEPWANRLVGFFDSYSEISPSGEGIRIFVRGKLPPGGRKRGNVEAYDSGRYLTVTGNCFNDGMPIMERQAKLETFHKKFFPPQEKEQPPSPPPKVDIDLSDDQVMQRALESKQGEKLRRLMEGDFSGFPSQSEADLALCSILAFWYGGDREKIDAVVRQSGLFRAKWDIKHFSDGRTYGERTIDRAVSKNTEHYRPKRRRHGGFRTI